MISTRNLSSLPGVDDLKRLLQSIAMLDAILKPDWQYRSYSFNAHWGAKEQVASMRGGNGDEFFTLFNEIGCFLKGFAHESPMALHRRDSKKLFPCIFDGIPPEFSQSFQDPAFNMFDTTFCIWRTYWDKGWERSQVDFPEGSDPDGSASLLSLFDGVPQTYQRWAEACYERPIALSGVDAIYKQTPLTQEIISMLNLDLSLEDAQKDSEEIGYPIAIFLS